MARQAKQSQDDVRQERNSHQRPAVRQLRVPFRSNVREEYRGFLPSRHSKITHDNIHALDSDIFWEEYITKRCPVVIDGLIKDDGFDGKRWKDLNYLRSIAGSTQVKIEPVDPINDRFGTGAQRRTVTLSHFLDMLQDEKQAGKWYMTTQYVDDEAEEHISNSTASSLSHHGKVNDSPPQASKDSTITSSATTSPPTSTSQRQSNSDSPKANDDEEILPSAPDLDFSLPPPTDSLAHLFPLPTPALLGGLVLQQCNLWLGSGASGKSSGLHHDFHDNLYMVLSGCKRFLIWPPICHRWLEPTGDVFRVHANGLIEYDVMDEPLLRADGLTAHEASLWRVRARKRSLFEADEAAALQSGEEKIKKALRKGKAKQTKEQEVALILLQEAEMQELIIRLDNEQVREANRNAVSASSSDLSDSEIESDLLSDRSFGEVDRSLSDVDNSESEILQRQGQTLSKNFNEGVDALKSLLSYIPMAEGEDDDDSFEQESEGSIDDSQDDQERFPSQNRRKKRRAGSFLHIPSGGLPGGLRGSLRDPDGRYDSDMSGDMSDSDEFIMAAMEDDGQAGQDEIFVLPMVPTIEGEWNEEDDGENAEAREVNYTANLREIIPESESSDSEEFEEDDDDDANNDKADDDVAANEKIDKLPFAELEEDSAESNKIEEAKLEDERSSSDESSEGALFPVGEEDSEDFEDKALLAKLANESDDEDEEDDEEIWTEDAEDGESLLNQLAAMDRGEGVENGANTSPQQLTGEKDEDPSSFSRIAPQALHWFFDVPNDPANKEETIPDDPPRIPGGPTLVPRENCPEPWEIYLKPGQMLYLPASWYHEVTSYCDNDEEKDNNVHMALNYWFHPPTAVENREGLPKRALTALNLDGTPKLGREAQKQAKARSSGSGNIDEATPSAQHPYLDREVWDEIRREVNRRVDDIRKRASKKGEKIEHVNVKRKADTSPEESHEDDTIVFSPIKRSRGNE